MFKTVHKNVVQNSDEWFNLRIGKYTSSNFGKICANMGKAFGEPAKDYARKKALEQVTGLIDNTASFKSSYMQRGNDLEHEAIELYEFENFCTVNNGGFYHSDLLGDSPDGLVGENGCIEVKTVIPKTHWKRIENKGYDSSYKWQIQGHIFLGDKDYCDFISYCPEFKPKPLYVYRVNRDEATIAQMKKRLEDFHELVNGYVKMIS